jgi:hypothetical protein
MLQRELGRSVRVHRRVLSGFAGGGRLVRYLPGVLLRGVE